MSAKFRREEKRRLEMDIALRNRINSVDKAEELILRIQDTIELIAFELQSERDFPSSDYTDDEREDWRLRAQRALAKFQIVLGQVQRRHELLTRMGSHK